MDSTRDAADLLAALAATAASFRQTGYTIYLNHQAEAKWKEFGNYGRSDGAPCTSIGFVISFPDRRELCVSVTVTAASEGLKVSADATIDDDQPDLPAGNQLYLLELPDVVTATVPECVATLRDYTQQLTGAAPGLVAQAVEQLHAGS